MYPFLHRKTLKVQLGRSDQAAAVEWLFRRTFWVIEEALLGYYQITREDAAELAQKLFLWFDRLSHRGGVYLGVEELRTVLLVGVCKSAHAYWLAKLGGSPAPNERLKTVLDRGPFEIAAELVKRLQMKENEEREKR